MAKVVHSAIMSLDGYIEDANGSFAYAEPDEEVHRAANDRARASSAFLFGRRLYETMEEPWQEFARRDDLPDVYAEFARLYVATPRYVFSDTLEEVPDGVHLVRSGEAVETVTRLKRELDGILDLGGAGLAASLIDLVDEFSVFVMPVSVGGGKPFFPLGERLDLRLTHHRAFASGAMELRYARADPA